MEEGVINENDDEKEITAENEDEVEMHIDITDYERENNWDDFDKVIE